MAFFLFLKKVADYLTDSYNMLRDDMRINIAID